MSWSLAKIKISKCSCPNNEKKISPEVLSVAALRFPLYMCLSHSTFFLES